MQAGRRINRLALVRKHRLNFYLHTIDRLLRGEVKPEYVAERWHKVKILLKVK